MSASKGLRGALPAVLAVLAAVAATAAFTVMPAAGQQKPAVGAFPDVVRFGTIARGTSAIQNFGVINGSRRPSTFSFASEGDIAPWLTVVDANDNTKAVTEVSVPPNSDREVAARMVVPGDTPNGRRQGTIAISSQQVDPDNPDAAPVNVQIQMLVTVTIGGAQQLTGELRDAGVNTPLEVGIPLRARASIANTGNVVATPVVHLTVLAGTRVVDSVDGGGVNVQPGATKTLGVDWPSGGLSPGDYLARVSADLAGTSLGERELPFTVVPRGSLNRKGSIQDLRVVGGVQRGGLTRLQARFSNQGAVEVDAALRAEVRVNGTVQSQATGDKKIVLPGGEEQLYVLVPTRKDGSYRAKASGTFEGVQTPPKTVAFDVSGGSSLVTILLIAGGLLLAVVLGIIGYRSVRSRRRRRSRRHRSAPTTTGRGPHSSSRRDSRRRRTRVRETARTPTHE